MGTVKKLHTRMVWMMLNAFDMVWPVGFHLAIPDLLEHWLFLPHFAWWKSGHKFLWCPSACLVSRSLPAEKPLKTIKNQEDYDYLHRFTDSCGLFGPMWCKGNLVFPARSPGQFLARQPKLPGRAACQKGSAPNRSSDGFSMVTACELGCFASMVTLWVMMPCSWYSLGNFIAIRLDCN